MGIQEEVRRLVNTESAKHKRLIEYVARQLRAGRPLAQVLDDPYVINRSNLVDRRALLEEPEVIEAAGGEAAIATLRAAARGGHREVGPPGRRGGRRYNRPRKGSISCGTCGGRGSRRSPPAAAFPPPSPRAPRARVLRPERDHHPVRAGAGLLLARVRRVAPAAARDPPDPLVVADLAGELRVRRGLRRLGLRLRAHPGGLPERGHRGGPRRAAGGRPGRGLPLPRPVRPPAPRVERGACGAPSRPSRSSSGRGSSPAARWPPAPPAGARRNGRRPWSRWPGTRSCSPGRSCRPWGSGASAASWAPRA